MSEFLYPFLDGVGPDVAALIDDLTASARAKAAASAELRTDTLERESTQLGVVADAMAQRFRSGGRLFTFGNGGSSTDASSVAALFAAPPFGEALSARCLAADSAVLTALGNDVGYELVFSRQLIAHARTGDIAIGMSTSGGSRNVMLAFAEARARGVLTLAVAGYDGGEMARSGDVDHCLIVRSESIHRIQETQAALAFALWMQVQARLADAAVERG